MIVRRRLASSAMSNGRSGTKTPWTSQRAAEFSSHSANGAPLTHWWCASAVAAVSHPQLRPITSWTTSIRGFAVCSAITLRA
jgi:hypothetical protein